MKIHFEVWLVCTYACFLMMFSFAIRKQSRFVHRRISLWQGDAILFHDGIALVLLIVSGFMGIVVLWRHHDPAELFLMGVLFALVVRCARRAWSIRLGKLRGIKGLQG